MKGWYNKHNGRNMSVNNDNDKNNARMVKFQATTSYVHATGGQDDWENVSTYIFSGGKTLQELGPNPDLPPVEKTTIVVSNWALGIAFGLLAIILLGTIASAICTCWFWNSRVVRASQPVSKHGFTIGDF